MKRYLNLSKAMLQRIKESQSAQSSTDWQQFAVATLILGVLLPAALQAKSITTQHETFTTDMGTFIAENHNSDTNKKAIIFIPGLTSNPSVYDGIKEQFNEHYFVNVNNAKVVMNTKARHFIMYDQPAWLVSQVRSFLEK